MKITTINVRNGEEILKVTGYIKVKWGFASGDEPGPRNTYGTNAEVSIWRGAEDKDWEKVAQDEDDDIWDAIAEFGDDSWEVLAGINIPKNHEASRYNRQEWEKHRKKIIEALTSPHKMAQNQKEERA